MVTNTYAHIVARIKDKAARAVCLRRAGDYLRPSGRPGQVGLHPNAGKLLMSFILSADGQKMLRDQEEFPATVKSNQSIPAAAGQAPRQ